MRISILLLTIALLTSGLIITSCSSDKDNQQTPGIDKSAYGQLPDGQTADLYSLRNAAGMTVSITNYGSIIVSLTAPDKAGKFDDVTLGL